MDRFVNSLSDQTKDTLVGIIDFGIAFCLVCLSYQVMQALNGWSAPSSSVPELMPVIESATSA
jgi:hypothetical protein